MQLCICQSSALKLLRELRAVQRRDLRRLPKGPLPAPKPPGKRWSRKALAQAVPKLTRTFAPEHLLEVAVPMAGQRITATGFRSVVHASPLPPDACIMLGSGLWMPCPELLFLEMASILSRESLIMLGFELCGSYSAGSDAYGILPATSVTRIQEFLSCCKGFPGISAARTALKYVRDNAWSPMEAIVAYLCMSKAGHTGYGLGTVVLNKRIGEGAGSRVPDILIAGTHVGINYDGEGHLDLSRIERAALDLAANPGTAAAERELTQAREAVRAKFVDDRRRDRALWRSGYLVFPITKEDIWEKGALDSFMACVRQAVVRETGCEHVTDDLIISNPVLTRMRQDYVWAFNPGTLGKKARARLARQVDLDGYQLLSLEIGTRTPDGIVFTLVQGTVSHRRKRRTA